MYIIVYSQKGLCPFLRDHLAIYRICRIEDIKLSKTVASCVWKSAKENLEQSF